MNTILRDLYKRFLFGKVSGEEFTEMKYYINKSSDTELSDLMETVWNNHISAPKMNHTAKEQIKTRLSFCIESDKRKSKKRNSLFRKLAVVAILFLMSGGFWFLIDSLNTKYETVLVEAPRGDKAHIVLPDGSKVRLNSGSIVTYDISNKKYRNVILKGEAFFEVSKDKKHPFIVKVNDIDIEVLGTSFNVRAYEDDDAIETSLVEGSIKLTENPQGKTFYLQPSHKAIYSKSGKKMKVVPTNNEEETAWLDGKLVFNSERLCDVMEKIERWYDVNIDLQYKDIADDRISGSFRNEQIYFVLEALRMQYKFNFEIKDNHIIITK